MSANPAPAASSAGRWLLRALAAFVAFVVLALGTVVGVVAWRRQVARDEQVARAEATFAPAVTALEQGGASAEEPYDIDATMRALHEMELALAKGGDPKDWLGALARQDYRRVPRDVLAARARMLKVLQRIYALQTEEEARAQFSQFTTALVLQTLGAVSIGAGADVRLDGDRLTAVVDDLKAKHAQELELQQAIAQTQAELVDVLHETAQATFRYVDEWDRLNLLRDRAYLSMQAGRFSDARAAADDAARRAPFDREAHLLFAWALIEEHRAGAASSSPSTSAPVETPTADRLAQAEATLRSYVNDHPGETAPALLLLGLIEQERGRPDDARLAFEQSAAYYPKQSERLQDLLDPYRARAFLRKTREGNYVVALYRSMMVGAGPFSPDLRLAKMAYDRGDEAGGRAKVMDHFVRRRGEREWSALVPDVRHAEAALGPHFNRIFPEDSFLDLVVDPALLGSKLAVRLKNRSDRELHNATLVLCVHLTDMHPDDCEPMSPPTQPVVLPNATTNFDAVEVAVDVAGQTKGSKDVVSVRAALVSDEVVSWVDTAQARVAVAEAMRRSSGVPAPTEPTASTTTAGKTTATASVSASPERSPPTAERATWQRVTGLTPDVVEKLLRSGLQAAVDAGLGDDNVVVRLPRELAILQPTIRLRYAGREMTSAQSTIDEGAIRVRFDDVANLEEPTTSRDMEIELGSRWLNVRAAVGPDASGQLRVRDVQIAD
jgi:tetratricopeptide (TPR) repeat protein